MKEEYQHLALRNNESSRRFEVTVSDYTAFIEYSQHGNTTALLHTEVPAALEGQGLGSALVEKVLTYLKQHHYHLVPRCPFVLAYLKRYPEWARIVQPAPERH